MHVHFIGWEGLFSITSRFFVINALFLSAAIIPAHAETVHASSSVSLHPSAIDCAKDGIALDGYDVVSYRQESGPFKGEADIKSTIQGVDYLFISQENKEIFEADKEKYLPSFSGWCAIALAEGRLTCPDYTNFAIEGDRLLLFETIAFFNGRKVWQRDPVRNFARAIENFSKLEDTPESESATAPVN